MRDMNDGILEREIDPSRQPPFPGGRLNSSGRFLLRVVLLCVLFGVIALALISFMRPEVKRPSWVGQRIRLPIPSVEREEKPPVFKPPEPQTVIQEEPGEEKARITGEKEVAVVEVEVRKPEIEEKEEGRTQVAVVEEPRARAEATKGLYTVNIASFRKRDRAQRLMETLGGKGYDAFVEEANIPQKGTWYRVAVGRFPSREEALAFARELKEQGIDYSFVRKLRE